MEYEFTDDEASLIKRVGFRLTMQGIILVLTGVFGTLYVIVAGSSPLPADVTAILMQSLLEIFMGGLLLYAPKHFTNVAVTEGSDISELVSGLNKLSLSFMMIWIIVLFNTIVDLTLISGGA